MPVRQRGNDGFACSPCPDDHASTSWLAQRAVSEDFWQGTNIPGVSQEFGTLSVPRWKSDLMRDLSLSATIDWFSASPKIYACHARIFKVFGCQKWANFFRFSSTIKCPEFSLRASRRLSTFVWLRHDMPIILVNSSSETPQLHVQCQVRDSH